VTIFTRIADSDADEFSVREEWINGLEVVQVVNNYREVQREGRFRVFDGDEWTSEVVHYRLPKDWALVP